MDKRILIVANGLSPDGGIGNCLYRMLEVVNKEYPKYYLDLLLNDVESAVLLRNALSHINVLQIRTDYRLCQSTKKLIKSISQIENVYTDLKILKARIKHKFNYKLELINLQADFTEKIQEEYDIAISYSAMPTYISTYVAKYVQAKKKILWVHGDVDQEEAFKIKDFSSLKIKGLKKYESIINAYDQIVTVSDSVKLSVGKIFPCVIRKIDTIYNFTDKQRIINRSKEFDVTFDDRCIKLLTVGRLSLEKGIGLAIDTIQLLSEEKVPFKWYFVGDNQIPKNLLDKIKKYKLDKYFVPLGVQKNPYPYYRACDIYVHTSYLEGYCTTTNEARMLGKPIITTDVAGAHEQIKDGWNGFVVQKNSRSIFDAIMKMIENSELMEQFSKNNDSIDFSNEESIYKIKELLK